MSDYAIITDTACDMPLAVAEKLGVTAVPLKASIAGKDFDCKLSSLDIGSEGFYDVLRRGVVVKTAAPSIDDYIRYFKKQLDRGLDILYIGFSTALSGAFNVGVIAAEELMGEYPDRKIICVDSLCGSMGQSLLVYRCVMRKKQGDTIEQVRDYAESIKGNICHWFTPDDLHFLKRGGRISATAAAVGSVMNIKPVLKTDESGKLKVVYKARGRKFAIAKMVEQFSAHYRPDEEGDEMVFITHADCPDDAQLLARSITKNCGVGNIMISEIGVALGAHCGPGTLALFYLGDER
ncbi:MAG: DegV family protein [Clostridia bacterium]|nr:DegV family protein [Clostridia bacterium]